MFLELLISSLCFIILLQHGEVIDSKAPELVAYSKVA